MVSKEERKKYWLEIGRECQLQKLYLELLQDPDYNEQDSKRYNVSKTHKELYGKPEGTAISKQTLLRPDFRLLLKGDIQRYATLKTREKFWKDYTPFERLEYWHNTPSIYRIGDTEQDGILRVPEMCREWAQLLLETAFWRIMCNDAFNKKKRVGNFVEHISVPKAMKQEIRDREHILTGKGWVL